MGWGEFAVDDAPSTQPDGGRPLSTGGLRRRRRRASVGRAVGPGTSPPRRFTSPVSSSALIGCRLVSPGLLLSLGVVVSEDGAALQGLRRPLKGRRHPQRGFPRPAARGF